MYIVFLSHCTNAHLYHSSMYCIVDLPPFLFAILFIALSTNITKTKNNLNDTTATNTTNISNITDL